jgi:hypothetical protein
MIKSGAVKGWMIELSVRGILWKSGYLDITAV